MMTSATERPLLLSWNVVKKYSPNSATIASAATASAILVEGSSSAAAETLNSSIIAMPAVAPGTAWVARAAAITSMHTLAKTIQVSQRTLRPMKNSTRARLR